MKRIYLASPYWHEDSAIREQRFREVCRVAARLMDDGYIVFCPIAHSHPIATYGRAPNGCHEFWMKQDFPMIEWADELWIALLNGYETSKGIRMESDYANKLGKPIHLVDKNTQKVLDNAKI